jgi:hypothetical protein
MKKGFKTSYFFPNRGVISVLESRRNTQKESTGFPLMEIEFENDEHHKDFQNLHELLRQTQAIAIAHTPNVLEDDEGGISSIVISFHSTRIGAEELDDPVMVMVLPVDTEGDAGILGNFDHQVDIGGHFGLCLHAGEYMTFLSIIEVFAVAPHIRQPGFDSNLAIYIGEPTYYGEFRPPLPDPEDAVIFVLNQYREILRPMPSENAINMTGLIPEGLA